MERVICSVSTKHCWEGSIPALVWRHGWKYGSEKRLVVAWSLGCTHRLSGRRAGIGAAQQLRPFQGSVGSVSSLTDLVAAGSSAGYLVGVVENGTGEDGDPR